MRGFVGDFLAPLCCTSGAHLDAQLRAHFTVKTIARKGSEGGVPKRGFHGKCYMLVTISAFNGRGILVPQFGVPLMPRLTTIASPLDCFSDPIVLQSGDVAGGLGACTALAVGSNSGGSGGLRAAGGAHRESNRQPPGCDVRAPAR